MLINCYMFIRKQIIQILELYNNSCKIKTVTCIPIARQRLNKHIPATRIQAAIGHPLLGNGSVMKPP
jgi:hypothetical protein